MNVHPAIRALRGDWPSQRRAQELLLRAIGEWRASATTRAVEADFQRYGAGASLDESRAISDLLDDHEAALAWVGKLFGLLMPILRQEHLGDLPVRFSCSEGFATIQLFAHGRATLNVVAHEPRRLSGRPQSLLLVDRESTELLLRGQAEGVFYRSIEKTAERREIWSDDREWQAGDRIELGSDDGRHLLEFDHTLLTLQLVRSAENPRPTCKYSLADGRLLQSASGDKQASRDLMALGVLGAMPVGGALEVMKRISLDQRRASDLRWEATRQALSVDAQEGIALLDQLAEHDREALAFPAARLKSQLSAAYPQLAEFDLEAA